MNLGQLIDMYEAGVLKVEDDSNPEMAVVGGMTLNREQMRALAVNLGWAKFQMEPLEVIIKTGKFIRGIKSTLGEDAIVDGTEVTFETTRIDNTMRYFDRIKLICPGVFDITVLYKVPGTPTTYTVYSDENRRAYPVLNARTLKQVAEYVKSAS